MGAESETIRWYPVGFALQHQALPCGLNAKRVTF